MASAKVTSKGQITIPIEIRNELDLKPGDQIFLSGIRMGNMCYSPRTARYRD